VRTRFVASFVLGLAFSVRQRPHTVKTSIATTASKSGVARTAVLVTRVNVLERVVAFLFQRFSVHKRLRTNLIICVNQLIQDTLTHRGAANQVVTPSRRPPPRALDLLLNPRFSTLGQLTASKAVMSSRAAVNSVSTNKV